MQMQQTGKEVQQKYAGRETLFTQRRYKGLLWNSRYSQELVHFPRKYSQKILYSKGDQSGLRFAFNQSYRPNPHISCSTIYSS
uniref:Uncharacterized protein n=1 Tax=Oryza brachyantha TaxID=4533 RepID=J3MGA6_ORYBR